MNKEMQEIVERPFEQHMIKSRPGGGNRSFSYVEGPEYIKRLNEAFGGCWSFKILDRQVFDDEVIVHGALLVHFDDGTCIRKEQFGGAKIKVSRNGEILSRADDLKAATTDCMKRCAAWLGIGLHLYTEDRPQQPQQRQAPPPPRDDDEAPFSDRVYDSLPTGDCGVSKPTNKQKATDKQIACITAIASKCGYDTNQTRSIIASISGGKKPSQITKKEASAIIDVLKKEEEAKRSHVR